LPLFWLLSLLGFLIVITNIDAFIALNISHWAVVDQSAQRTT
jgi:hypothetical protein